MTSTNLVFDLGFHRGEDTDHYLALGHRVVAVEANNAQHQKFSNFGLGIVSPLLFTLMIRNWIRRNLNQSLTDYPIWIQSFLTYAI